MEYPVILHTDVLHASDANTYQDIADLGKNMKWEELIEKLNNSSKTFINASELPVANGPAIPFRTPLHHAVAGSAPKEILERLIEMGASKCMKTDTNETAFDLANANGSAPDILQLLKEPEEVQKDEEAIKKMEMGLHSVINGRVEDLIKKHGLLLPQLSFLFEKCKDEGFYYSVPGMFGGFLVSCVENGIQAESWVRICSGSEQTHFIDREGKVSLLHSGDDI